MQANELIKEYRKKAKLTQTELGKMIGVGRSTIARYESGEIYPSQKMMIALHNHFAELGTGNFFQDLWSNEEEPTAPTFADHLMLLFCDVYNPRNNATNGKSYCEIWQDNESYLVEQSKLDDFFDRAIRHLQIEFDALIFRENEYTLQYKKYEFPRFEEELSDGNK